MKRLTAYKVITAASPELLSIEVERHLNDGSPVPWTLQGGVSIAMREPGVPLLAQALTRTVKLPRRGAWGWRRA